MRRTRTSKEVLRKVGLGLGILRGVQEEDSLMTVEYWGTGTMREVGPKTVGPPVQIKSYYAAVAYDFPGMRLDMTRAGGTAPPREIQVVSGRFAWNEIDKIGGGLPGWGSAVPAMDAVTDRLLRLWTTPFGVYKAAVAAGEKAKVTVERSRCRSDVSVHQLAAAGTNGQPCRWRAEWRSGEGDAERRVPARASSRCGIATGS